jgi:DNA polymerase
MTGVASKDKLDECRRCELWEHATQGVPGEGPAGARIMLVGEQPGDEEDVQGRPFVGPAGRLLRTLLDEAGIPVGRVYMTNAVKHFHFEPRGKRRIHKTPLQRHVAACHVWLEAELARERPAVIVTLGATALAAVYGNRIAIVQARTRKLANAQGTPIVATYHPSAILRVPDHDARVKLRDVLVADLARAARMAG